MIIKGAHHLILVHVPDFRDALVRADGHVIALVAPGDARHFVVIVNFAEPRHLGGAGGPDVHTAVQANRQNVLAAPVDEVQVEVIADVGRVENLVGCLGDTAQFGLFSIYAVHGRVVGAPVLAGVLVVEGDAKRIVRQVVEELRLPQAQDVVLRLLESEEPFRGGRGLLWCGMHKSVDAKIVAFEELLVSKWVGHGVVSDRCQ